MKQLDTTTKAVKVASSGRGFMRFGAKLKVSFLLIVLAFSFILPLASPQVTEAAGEPWPAGGNFIADEIYENASAHQHYYFLYSCFMASDIDNTTRSEVDGWDFFQGGGDWDSVLGAMYPGAGTGGSLRGLRSCENQAIVEQAYNYLGFNNSREAFCSLTGRQYDGNNVNQATCTAGAGDGTWDNNASRSQRAASFANAALSRKPAMGGPEQYVRAYQTLVSARGCDMQFQNTRLYDAAGDVPGTSAGNTYAVPVVIRGQNGNPLVRYVQGIGIPNSGSNVNLAYVATTGAPVDTSVTGRVTRHSCNEIVEIARANVGAYRNWLQAHPNAVASTAAAAGDTGDDDEEAASTCTVDGVGWLVCPVVEFLGDLNDQAFEYLSMLLRVPSSIITNDGTRTAWSAFRDIANVAFVIALLLIIYSQITGAGISNYGLKKLAPKLIIAALLVNISFWVCAGLVDLSNIVGSGLHSLLSGIPVSGGTTRTAEGLAGIWATAAPVLLATVGGIGLILLIVLAPTVLLAFAVVILILIARQAFVILLIVISPLAFVAYLLPNTEQWFKKWWKAMVAVLMVYPLVALVFGGSTLAANILLSVGSAGADGFADGISPELMQIIGASIMALPLFAVPALLKGSMAAAGTVGAKLSNLQDRANTKSANAIKNSRIGEAKQAYDRRKAQRKVDSRLGQGRITKVGNYLDERGFRTGKVLQSVGGANAKFDQTRAGRYFGGSAGAASAVFAQQKLNKESVEQSAALLQNNAASEVVTKAKQQFIKAAKSGDVIAARAATQVLATQTGSKGIDVLRDAIDEVENDGGFQGETRGNVQHDISSAGLKPKNRSLDRWSRDERATRDANGAVVPGTEQKLTSYDSDPTTAGGLSSQELAGHSIGQLRRFGSTTPNAAIQATAQRTVNANDQGTISLDADKRAIFEHLAAGRTYNSTTNNWT